MDRRNLADLAHLSRTTGGNSVTPRLLLDFAPHEALDDIPDPYLEGGFERVYDLIEAATKGLLAHLQKTA